MSLNDVRLFLSLSGFILLERTRLFFPSPRTHFKLGMDLVSFSLLRDCTSPFHPPDSLVSQIHSFSHFLLSSSFLLFFLNRQKTVSIVGLGSISHYASTLTDLDVPAFLLMLSYELILRSLFPLHVIGHSHSVSSLN